MQRAEQIFPSGTCDNANAAYNPGNARTSYAVKFGAGAVYRRIMPNSFSFHGKGAIDFQQKTVTISGKRHRVFRFGVPEEHVFRRADICNARTIGKIVRFDVHLEDDDSMHQVGFVASDPQTARDIAALLPTQQTQSFSADQAERGDFQTRLLTLGPSAPLTPIIVVLNLAIFALMAWNGAGFLHPDASVAIRWGSNYGPLTLGGQWWRLFTATFIHFGILHVAFNMLALYLTGRMVERIYGSAQFLLLYVFAGLCGSVVSLLWHPMVNSAGASGAIFGVFGALLAFMVNPRNAVPASIMKEHRNSTVIFIGYNLLNGFSHAGIDNGAHIGGLLGGIVMGFVLARPLEAEARAKPAAMRLLIASLAGILALGALSYPLAYQSEEITQEQHFGAALGAFEVEEKQATDDINALTEKNKTKSIDDAAFADALEQDIIPQWQHLRAALAEPKLVSQSKYYPLQQVLLHYLNDRIKACTLAMEGLRTNNRELISQIRSVNRDIQLQHDLLRKMEAH